MTVEIEQLPNQCGQSFRVWLCGPEGKVELPGAYAVGIRSKQEITIKFANGEFHWTGATILRGEDKPR